MSIEKYTHALLFGDRTNVHIGKVMLGRSLRAFSTKSKILVVGGGQIGKSVALGVVIISSKILTIRLISVLVLKAAEKNKNSV